MNLCLYSAKALACFVHGKMNNLYQQIARCLVIFFFLLLIISLFGKRRPKAHKKINPRLATGITIGGFSS